MKTKSDKSDSNKDLNELTEYGFNTPIKYSDIQPYLKKVSDRYLPEIVAALETIFKDTFAVASDYQDKKECSDLIGVETKDRIAVRTRKNKYKHYQDLTIRYELDRNNITEIDKILDGWGNYYCYCYLKEDETGIEQMTVIDMQSVKYALAKGEYQIRDNVDKFGNKDGSKLAAIPFSKLAILQQLEIIEGKLEKKLK